MRSDKILLKNVRLLYPWLHKTKLYNGKDTGKYHTIIMIDKEDKDYKDKVKTIKKAMKLAVEREKAKNPKFKVNSDRYCLKDGDNEEHNTKGNENLEGHFYLSSNLNKNRADGSFNGKPDLRTKNKGEEVTEEMQLFYSGSYANVIIDFWTHDDGDNSRVNSNLIAVQFEKHGEKLGGSDNAPARYDPDMFDFDDDDDDDDDDLDFDDDDDGLGL